MRVAIWAGTAAEYIKLFPVINALKTKNIEVFLISSGQNLLLNSPLLSLSNSSVELVLSNPTKNQTASGLLKWFIKTFITSLFKVPSFVRSNKIDYIVIHGDTVSTMMGAIVGRLSAVKIAHVEAGLRSFSLLRPFPEEICRIVASRFVDISFCPNNWAANNLRGKVGGQKVVTEQNTLLDSLQSAKMLSPSVSVMEKINRSYFIFVLHRQENLFDTSFVEKIFDRILKESSKHLCVMIVHKPTEIVLRKLGIFDKIMTNPNIIVFERLDYVTFTHVLIGCDFIVTDGGSNQEECFFLGKSCLVLRSESERTEGLGENVKLAGKNFDIIEDFLANPGKFERPPIATTESPSKVIANFLVPGDL